MTIFTYKFRLKDVTEIQVGFPFKSAEYSETGIKLLRGDNIGQGFLQWNGVKFWPIEKSSQLSQYILQKDDVVIAMDRPWVSSGLKYSVIHQEDDGSLLVQRVARLRSLPGIHKYILPYIIGSGNFTNYILSVQTGTTIPHISLDQIGDYEFFAPPIKEQEKIGSLLRRLDNKIDLNRRTNETLEAMARALFRDWFVDFGPTRAKMAGEAPYLAPELWELFPDRLDDEGKPEGWKTEPLDETATFLNGLALQKYPATGDTSLPAIKIAQLRSESTETADPVSPDIPDDYIIEQNDLLFSWSGSLLCKFWNGQRGALNQHLFKVTSKRFEPWFIYEWIQFYMPEFQAIAADKATTMGHIQRRHLTESLVTIPPANIMQAANNAIGSLIEQIQSNNGQSRTLAQLRDLLLPKLMSGEISIRDAEKMVEDAA